MAKILQDAFSPEEDEKEPQVSDELEEPAAESDDLLAEEPVESDELELEDDLGASEEPAFGGESDELELDGDLGDLGGFGGGAESGQAPGYLEDFNQQGELDAPGLDDALSASTWRGQQDGEPDSPDAVRQKTYGENHYGRTDMSRLLGGMSAPSAESDELALDDE